MHFVLLTIFVVAGQPQEDLCSVPDWALFALFAHSFLLFVPFTTHSLLILDIQGVFMIYSGDIQNILDLFWTFILDICSGHFEYPVNYSTDYSCFSQALFLIVYTAQCPPDTGTQDAH